MAPAYPPLKSSLKPDSTNILHLDLVSEHGVVMMPQMETPSYGIKTFRYKKLIEKRSIHFHLDNRCLLFYASKTQANASHDTSCNNSENLIISPPTANGARAVL